MVQPIRLNSTDKVSIGPAVVIGDGFTMNTSLTLSGADSARAKLGDDTTVDISGYTWAATTNMDGEFDLTLQAGITDTPGPMTILIEDVSLVLPLREKFYVYAAVVYDSLFADSPTLLTSKDIGQMSDNVIATVTSQTEHIMTTALVTNDTWNGQIAMVEDISTGEPWVTWISDMVASTDTLHLGETPPFTIVAGDIIRVRDVPHPRFELNSYDPPTRAELTTDTTSILNKVLALFRVALRNDAAVTTDQATEISDINKDDGAGSGTFDHTEDSLEAGVTKINNIVLKTDGTGGQNIGGP